ncbi:unnamed protein product, partial [marine sediment metagenome]
MTTHHHFQSENRGAVFRPPTMRIVRSKVSTTSAIDDPDDQDYGKPSWGEPTVEPYWHPLILHWGSNGQLTTLQIKIVLGQGSGKSRMRAEASPYNPGDHIELMQVGVGEGPEEEFVKPWFSGYIAQESMLIQAHPDVESVTLTAYGTELLLSHKIITGMWVAKADQGVSAMQGTLSAADAIRTNAWEARLPVIMNDKGLGNASEETWQLTNLKVPPLGYAPTTANNRCRVFASPGATAGDSVSELWTAYTALRSVV